MNDKTGIILYPATFLSGIGKRENNEDTYYPHPDLREQVSGLYMVCDGVGGHQKGEVASATLCREVGAYLSAQLSSGAEIGEEMIRASVLHAQEMFRDMEKEEESLRGMATTLTLAFIRPKDILVAHCGDSRVYHLRNGKVLFRTEDHSLVNFLVQRGEITPGEAAGHPQRNVILRSVSAVAEPVEVEINILQNILPGDYLLLCTDGVLEAWGEEEELAALFHSADKPEQIVKAIESRCVELSRDNYTCICLQIASVKRNGILDKFKSLFQSKL